MAGNRTDWYGEVELLSESDAAQFYALLETITVRTGQDRGAGRYSLRGGGRLFCRQHLRGTGGANIQSRAGIYLQEQYEN